MQPRTEIFEKKIFGYFSLKIDDAIINMMLGG
jgi:hypothetical protein